MVQIDPDLEPAGLVAVEIEIKPSTRVDSVAISDLSPNWRQYPALVEPTSIGEQWIRAAKSVGGQ